jgi:hypothetical protein
MRAEANKTRQLLAAVVAVALASCGPEQTAPVEEFIFIKYSIDGKPRSFVEDPQIVADDESSIFVIVQLPLGVLPKEVTISTTLGSFGRSGSTPVSSVTQNTDPESAAVRFRLFAGARPGIADLTVTVKAPVDGEILEFTKFDQVAFKTACPTRLELRPDASNMLLEFSKVPFQIVAVASRPGSVKPEGIGIDFAVPTTTKDDEDAGVIFVESSPFTDSDGRLRASFYPSLEGEILITATSTCRLLPGTGDTSTDKLSGTLKVTYKKEATP